MTVEEIMNLRAFRVLHSVTKLLGLERVGATPPAMKQTQTVDRVAETAATKACGYADAVNAEGAKLRGRGETPAPALVDAVLATQTADALPEIYNRVNAYDDCADYAKRCRTLHRQK
jgi:hypothetical protein